MNLIFPNWFFRKYRSTGDCLFSSVYCYRTSGMPLWKKIKNYELFNDAHKGSYFAFYLFVLNIILYQMSCYFAKYTLVHQEFSWHFALFGGVLQSWELRDWGLHAETSLIWSLKDYKSARNVSSTSWKSVTNIRVTSH